MQKIYYIYGKNTFLVQKRVKELQSQFDIDPFNIVTYDIVENDSETILEDLVTISFFGDKKIIIINSFEEIIRQEEHIINDYINYLNAPNDDVVLLIVSNTLIKTPEELGRAIELKTLIERIDDLDNKDYPDFIKDIVEKYDYKINNDALELLIDRTSYDLQLIVTEIEKLMIYTAHEMLITIKDVEALVPKSLEENIYELTNAFFINNRAKVIEIFYDLMALNEEPIRIINNIVVKTKELITVKLLLEKKFNQEQIANYFNISLGRTYYLIRDAKKISMDILENFLLKLGELDVKIKSGQIDKKIGLELFLLGE